MNQIWQYWQGAISPEKIKLILDVAQTYPVTGASLGFDGSTSNNNQRSSELRWVDTMDPKATFIIDLLWYFAREANKNAFGFDIDYIPEVQFTSYSAEANGKYDWHYDTFWANPTVYDRKLSIVIQLSDSDSYTGGNFQFDSQLPQPPEEAIRTKGTVIVFPSFLLHRVTPVLSGTRNSLVTWVQGPKFR